MDILFWGSFGGLFFAYLLVAKLVFRAYTPSKPLKECRDPPLQYWRFYLVQLANFRVLLSVLFCLLFLSEQSFISKYRLLQLMLQNICSNYALNLILDSIFHHTKQLARFQQKTVLIFTIAVLFSSSVETWNYVFVFVALNELPNLFLLVILRQYPQNSLIFSSLFLISFIASRYIMFAQIYPGFLENPLIGIQFKLLAIAFEQCQLIWTAYFLERFFKLMTDNIKKLEQSEKPKLYKKVRDIFQFLLRSKKGKFILGLSLFTSFFQKTVITVILRNSDEMIHL